MDSSPDTFKIFIDIKGQIFHLEQNVDEHIKYFHPEINDDIITKVLTDPDTIVKSSWDQTSQLHYKKQEKYFKVVVVDIDKSRIKTVLTTDKIKKGEILWKKPN